jgi:subtilisin family serine protease
MCSYCAPNQSFSAVAASLGKGAVLIMPAGNDSQPNARVPVTSPISVAQGVISVGAVQQGNSGYQVAFFSNSLPTVCAPGVEILSAHLGGKLRSLQGTSMSCANAAVSPRCGGNACEAGIPAARSRAGWWLRKC